MGSWTAITILLILFCGTVFAEEEYSFDLSEIEEKPLEIGGYLEFRPVLFKLDRDSALYKLKMYDRGKKNIREEYNFKSLIGGTYKKGITEFHALLNTDLKKSYLGWSEETKFYDGYITLRPSSAFNFSIGKQSLKWGKGYAWNPVAFLDRPKDPEDPELAREGYTVISADYIKSFDGPLKTFSFTPVLMPVYDHVNNDFGKNNYMNFAGKIYLLLYDTDIDFIFLMGQSKANRYGMDFSSNITSNFEVHGEVAFIDDHQKRFIDSDGTVFNEEYDATSYLIGLRYLTESDTTYIFEYYLDATGLSESEMQDYFSFIDKGYDDYLNSGDDSLLRQASNAAGNPMRDYLYLRASQKEPFDMPYVTPSITTILNIDDSSVSVSPELLYTGIDNLELRLKATFLAGNSYTEFGEKLSDSKIELRIRYYF